MISDRTAFWIGYFGTINCSIFPVLHNIIILFYYFVYNILIYFYSLDIVITEYRYVQY